MDGELNTVYLVIRTIPENYRGDDVTVVYAGTSRDEAIREAESQSKNTRRYIDIQVWVNGKETTEYVSFTE